MKTPSLIFLAGAAVLGATTALGQPGSVAGGGTSNYSPGGYSGRSAFDITTFFPPAPPTLGAPLAAYNPTIGWPAPPWEVSEYISDLFYPPYSSRLVMNDVPKKLKARVDAYGVRKAALLKDLRAKLESLKNADAAVRERELTAFAAAQSDALVALENEGDELRTDLTSGGLFHESVDWNYTRAWRLNEAAFRSPTDGMIARLQVMRAAAYYQRGFTPAQRRLLKEISMEISDAIERATPEGTNPAAPSPDDVQPRLDSNPVYYFSPETARFRVPPGLPPALRVKMSAYEARKSALKGELQGTVAEKDSAIFNVSRSRAADALAKKQEAEIAVLEQMADDIRRDLAAVPEAFRRPQPPNLPPSILARMSAWVRERRVMQDSVFFLVEDIKRKVRVERISYRRQGAGADAPSPTGRRTLSITVAPEDENEAKLSVVRQMVDKHTTENRPRSAHLESERIEIRREVARLVGDENLENPAAINALIDDAFDVLDRIEEWAIYSDYRTAMFELGLTPPQRRLLLDGALRSLNLALPPEDRSLRIMMPR